MRGLRIAVFVLVLPAVIAACSASSTLERSHRRTQSASPRARPARPRPTTPDTPTASGDVDGPTGSFPAVGALFQGSARGAHFCTGSVLTAGARNTVITAAHCVPGTGSGLVFVPDYRRGRAPFGVWPVTGVYVSPRWMKDADPHADYAVLTVSSRTVAGRTEQLADVVGGEGLGDSPAPGAAVTLVAYNAGRDDVPVVCTADVYRVAGYPTVDCHGFVGGSSGSPWLTPTATGGFAVNGVIGGRRQGGCHEYTSHTSPFTADVLAVVGRADRGAPPDTDVPAGQDSCP